MTRRFLYILGWSGPRCAIWGIRCSVFSKMLQYVARRDMQFPMRHICQFIILNENFQEAVSTMLCIRFNWLFYILKVWAESETMLWAEIHFLLSKLQRNWKILKIYEEIYYPNFLCCFKKYSQSFIRKKSRKLFW